MSVQLIDVIDEKKPQTQLLEEETEAIPLPPTDLPYDDGEPLESNRHRIAMNVLINSLHQAYQGRNDYYSSGNMFVYYSSQQVKNKQFRGPDFFAVLDVDGTKERRSWIIWEEEGRYPNVIVELMSASTASVDLNEKKRLYEKTFRTQDYFVYDPFNSKSLQGWYLGEKGRYRKIRADKRGWLWCETLGLWLGTWNGELTKENAPWLRFYDAEGNLVLLPEEVAVLEAERAEQEAERAEQEAERAEQEAERAEQEAARAEQEAARAEQAESERDRQLERATQAELELQALRDKLRQLDIDPDTLS
ncbi:Uma2 family endonuclease [Roseofilum casamattae]|uniref:Uma2 family endonuclease n=1 Tax=Roseofilum casamattae BLCC-M143 TaxID=3022442 RepID=A0ABT7BY05_9CYAN|nr:Uma2 family endonuclease [Roseofilum casamattae]MDJ1184079.1 Uma2 family endonuclease [Roseofilum casamattae BLCC-M143]